MKFIQAMAVMSAVAVTSLNAGGHVNNPHLDGFSQGGLDDARRNLDEIMQMGRVVDEEAAGNLSDADRSLMFVQDARNALMLGVENQLGTVASDLDQLQLSVLLVVANLVDVSPDLRRDLEAFVRIRVQGIRFSLQELRGVSATDEERDAESARQEEERAIRSRIREQGTNALGVMRFLNTFIGE